MEVDAKELKTFAEKCFGLLNTNKPYAVYFKTRWGIHTFFMKFSIDVVILDNNGIIVSLIKKLRPWRIYIWNPQYENVLELPAGTIEKLNLELKQKVKIKL